jgi:hypothetical protein
MERFCQKQKSISLNMELNNKLKDLNDRFINYLLLNASFNNDIGLLTGKSAAVLFFAMNKDLPDKNWIEDILLDHIEEVLKQINKYTPMTFGDGIAGVGGLLNYLHKQGYLDNNATYFLEETERYFFNAVLGAKIDTYGLKYGVAGIAEYFLNLYLSEVTNNSIRTMRIQEALISCFDQIEKFWKFQKGLPIEELNIHKWQGWQSVLSFLVKLKKINLCNYQAEILQFDIMKELIYRIEMNDNSKIDQFDVMFNLIIAQSNYVEQEMDVQNKLFELLQSLSSNLKLILTSDLSWLTFQCHLLQGKYIFHNINGFYDIFFMELVKRLENSCLNEIFEYNLERKSVDIGIENGVCSVAISLLAQKNMSSDWMKVLGFNI